jgi:hypothetical protein
MQLSLHIPWRNVNILRRAAASAVALLLACPGTAGSVVHAFNDPRRGHERCRCIDPSALGLTNLCDPSNRATAGGRCYPASYGAAACDTHDSNITLECVSKSEPCRDVAGRVIDCVSNREAVTQWCGAKWCWVDPSACDLSTPQETKVVSQATYIAPAMNRTAALHYSYETCGNLNNYDPSRFDAAMRSAGKTLRISFPSAITRRRCSHSVSSHSHLHTCRAS